MSDGMVTCSGCKAEYDGSGYDPGDRFQCPECNTIVTIPGASRAPAASPAKSSSRGNTGRRASSSGGGTRRASRPPMTAKMRVVSEAVGMGALDPNADMRAIRRASAPPPQAAEGTDKMMLYGGVGVIAIAIIGLVIWLAKQPSAEDKKKEMMAKKAAAAAKEEEKKAASGSSATSTDKPKPHTDGGWDIDETIDAEVMKTLADLKTHPVDAEFAKIAAKLLRHGRKVIPSLVEAWPKVDGETANVSRLIVEASTGRSLPEGLFAEKLKRMDMAMTFRAWWMDDTGTGPACQLVSEDVFSRKICGEGISTNPPPDATKPPDSEKPPGGVTEIKKPTGGKGEVAMRHDLPQHLSNYVHGTGEERDRTLAEIKSYGKPVIGALIASLKEDDPSIAGVANDLLQMFTKQDFGRPPGEPGDRGPFIQKWQDWWKGAEATFTM